jgi:hypothetical protein
MVIEKKDFEEIHATIKEHLNYDASTIFYLPGNGVKKDGLTFCSGAEDVGLFYHHHPYDSDWYHSIGVHSLAKVMDKIEKGELHPKIITEGSAGKQFIDLGMMVKENDLIEGLHYKMKNADWRYEYSDDFKVWQKGEFEIRDIKNDLKELSQTPEGKVAANNLWQQYVPLYSVSKPEYLDFKNNIMDERTLGFNEGQFKRLGMQEAFTPQLVEQMKQRVPLIEHPFPKNYDGDKTDNTIHLKKSSSSDNYFINKFDMNLQKEGEDKSIKQTFYVDNKKKEGQELENGQKEKHDNNFTLKKAYNFLSGRPVYHADSQSWEQIDLSKKLTNGNYATQRFDKSYGFDLGKAIDNYSLANPQYKPSLMESLQRGNLQKEKFVDKDGKVDEYYVSPSIKTGSLNMYDENKKPIPVETQIEKQLISKEFGEQLKQLFQKKQTHEQKQTQGVKQSQTPGVSKAKQSQSGEVKAKQHTAKPKVK